MLQQAGKIEDRKKRYSGNEPSCRQIPAASEPEQDIEIKAEGPRPAILRAQRAAVDVPVGQAADLLAGGGAERRAQTGLAILGQGPLRTEIRPG